MLLIKYVVSSYVDHLSLIDYVQDKTRSKGMFNLENITCITLNVLY